MLNETYGCRMSLSFLMVIEHALRDHTLVLSLFLNIPVICLCVLSRYIVLPVYNFQYLQIQGFVLLSSI